MFFFYVIVYRLDVNEQIHDSEKRVGLLNFKLQDREITLHNNGGIMVLIRGKYLFNKFFYNLQQDYPGLGNT